MKKLALAVTLALVSTGAIAGQNENIEMCADKVLEFSGKSVDMFDASYKKGSWTKWNKVQWSGIECEVGGAFGIATVFNLRINGEHVIVDGYAGAAAKKASQRIDAEVDAAVETLKARIDILKNMRDDAEKKLKAHGVDALAVEAKVNSAIERVTQ